MLGHLPTTSGSRYLHRCRSAPAAGGCPILAHHFGQQAVMSLQSITNGKAFGALSCGSAETALLPLSILFFYIVFVLGFRTLQSITKGKAFGALSCGSAETALLPLSILFFYIVFVLGFRTLRSITKGKAFGALSCGSAETALLPLSISFFYIVFVLGVSHSAECDQGRCPLETHELFVKSSIKNFIIFRVSGLRFRSPERVSAGRFPRPESASRCTDPANWFCR